MATDDAGCPNCGEPVKPGDTLCSNCGLNLVSGESYEEKLKRSRGRQKTAKEGTPVGGIALAVTFGLLLLAGFLYQGRIIKVLRAEPDEFSADVARLQRVEHLVDQALKAETASQRERLARQARNDGEDLIEELRDGAEAIKIEAAPTTDQQKEKDRTPKALRRAKKTFLRNLAAKAEFHLSRLPND